MALSARWIAYYPYATPADLKSALGAARLTSVQIEEYARQIAGFTRLATWTVDTNTVGVFVRIADCRDQDVVARRSSRLGGQAKTVNGSLAYARTKKTCTGAAVTPPTPLPSVGMSTTTKLLLAGVATAFVAAGAFYWVSWKS